jgi:hypothetical protein
VDSKRQSVARGESRRYEANMAYLVSLPFTTKKRNRSQPAEKSRPHHNKRYAFTNLIGDYLVILNWLRLICAALPAGRERLLV